MFVCVKHRSSNEVTTQTERPVMVDEGDQANDSSPSLTTACWSFAKFCAMLLLTIAFYSAVLGRPYYRSCLWHDVSPVCLSVVCDVLYCGETVRPSEKVSEGVNRKPGSKSLFFGSPPYFYFRFRRYGHRDGRFCLIFARTAK